MGFDKAGDKPGSVPLARAAVIPLGRALLSGSSNLPEDNETSHFGRAETRRPLRGLAPGGVCHATAVTNGPVRSYRTISPLPTTACASRRRYIFCGTFLRVTPTGG